MRKQAIIFYAKGMSQKDMLKEILEISYADL